MLLVRYLLESGFSKNDMLKIQEGWDILKLMVERLRKKILDILYYAKERTLKIEKIDFASFVKGICLTVEAKMKKCDISFVKDFSKDLGDIEIDEASFRPAIINIIENAVEACVADKTKKSGRVVFKIRQDQGSNIFEISDNGIGMDRETKENMFTLFFSSKGSKGTGFGLFIAHKIIAEHGGEIKVDSEPGFGSHFIIKIPRHIIIDTKK